MGHNFRHRRSVVEMCLEFPWKLWWMFKKKCEPTNPTRATVIAGRASSQVPNEVKPCEPHFVFEPFVETRHWERTHTLSIRISNESRFEESYEWLILESCRFFSISPLQLTSLKSQVDRWEPRRKERASTDNCKRPRAIASTMVGSGPYKLGTTHW